MRMPIVRTSCCTPASTVTNRAPSASAPPWTATRSANTCSHSPAAPMKSSGPLASTIPGSGGPGLWASSPSPASRSRCSSSTTTNRATACYDAPVFDRSPSTDGNYLSMASASSSRALTTAPPGCRSVRHPPQNYAGTWSSRRTQGSICFAFTPTSRGPSSTTLQTNSGCCSGRISHCNGATHGAFASRPRRRLARPSTYSVIIPRLPCGVATTSRSSSTSNLASR